MEHKITRFLKGNLIYLREVRISDVNDNYYQWLNDPEVNQYLEIRFSPMSKEIIAEFVRSMDGNPNSIFLAICTIANDLHIGNIKLGPINWTHRFADISLIIGDKRYWKKGVATEAIGLITRFAFENLNIHKVKAGCYAENIGSLKAFEKNGFQREGLLKQHRFFMGKFVDQVILGLINSEWKG